MKASKRISTLNAAGSDGWEILYAARDMRRAGQTVLDLTVGDHDRITPDLILDEMIGSARGGHTGYADVAGIPALRDAIAARVEARTGVPTHRENVLVTPGGQAGLFGSFMATLDPGDTALFIDPHYATYPGTIRAASGISHSIAARPEAGFQPEMRDLESAPEAKVLLMNTPNNPTGVVYSAATMNTLAGFAKARDLWVISDEVYDGQVWEGAHISMRALPEMAERTLVVGSLSKSHVMTGSRLGWVVGPAGIVSHLANLATNTTYGVPGYIQDAAVVALVEGDGIEAELTATYRARRDLALKVVAGFNGITAVPSAGAMYVMLDIRSTAMSGREFAARLIDAHDIAVMPGESFGAAAAGHLRIALTRDACTLETALRTLARFAEEIRDAA